MATMRTTLRDWLGLPGAATRGSGARRSMVVWWLRRLACLGVVFAIAGAVMQALGHAWGPDALGFGLSLLAGGYTLSTFCDLAEHRSDDRESN